ncbi:MAG: DUF805 domain-containing protein [Rhodoblastus sp.]
MPVHFLWFLLDWRGRIGRSAYRTAMLVLALLVAALQLVPEKLHAMLAGVLVAQLVVQAALDAKRLHDIGMSAIWVPAVSVACICGVAVLAAVAPGGLDLVGQHVHDILGPAANKSGPLAISLAGLETAAVLRSALLWAPKSNAGGDVYAYEPGKVRLAGLEAGAKGGADAAAIIARALAAQAAEAENRAAQPGRATAPAPNAASGPRKTFGMRKTA